MILLASCSQVVILQSADVIKEGAPTISFTSITPGEFSASTSEVRVFGSSSENTQFVTLYSNESCSTLLAAGSPSEFSNLGIEITLASETTTRIYGLAKTESGLESDCTHLVDFTHSSIPALGLALASPASSPGNDSTPSFTVTVDGGALLSSDDKITLHSGTTCSGAALNIDEATVSTNTLDGLSLGTTTLTLAASSAQVVGGALYSVKRVNADGVEKCSSSFSVSGQRSVFYEYDNVNPSAPDFTGGSHTDGELINDTTPTFSGAAGSVEAGATVNVTVVGGGGSSCSAVAAGDGSWSCTVDPALTGGASVALTLTVEQVDVAGNTGPSDSFSLTLDTVAPSAVTGAGLSPGDGALINNLTPTILGTVGTAEAGASVEVSVTGSGSGTCSTTAAGDGSWSCEVTPALTSSASASLTVSATATDAAGNTSTATTINWTLDTVDPSAPVISSPADSATVTSGDITVSGTGEMNASISVSVDGQSASCTDTANGAGAWSCTLDETLVDGSYTIRVVQTDAAGNGPSTESAVSVTVEISASLLRIGDMANFGRQLDDVDNAGTYAVYRRPNTGTEYLYLLDLSDGSSTLVSKNLSSSPVAVRNRARISGDGDYVVFVSTIALLGEGTNISRVYRWHRPSDTLELLLEGSVTNVDLNDGWIYDNGSGPTLCDPELAKSAERIFEGLDVTDDGDVLVVAYSDFSYKSILKAEWVNDGTSCPEYFSTSEIDTQSMSVETYTVSTDTLTMVNTVSGLGSRSDEDTDFTGDYTLSRGYVQDIQISFNGSALAWVQNAYSLESVSWGMAERTDSLYTLFWKKGPDAVANMGLEAGSDSWDPLPSTVRFRQFYNISLPSAEESLLLSQATDDYFEAPGAPVHLDCEQASLDLGGSYYYYSSPSNNEAISEYSNCDERSSGTPEVGWERVVNNWDTDNSLMDVRGSTLYKLSSINLSTSAITPLYSHEKIGSSHSASGLTSYFMSASADGDKVGINTFAPLKAQDANNKDDFYVYDVSDGSMTLVSKNASGDAANQHSNGGLITGDGSLSFFLSNATDLGITNSGTGIFSAPLE